MTQTEGAREYPILFSSPMILALLAGRKHVTRRLDKRWLKVKDGDRLWVKEAWRPWGWHDDNPIRIQFRADLSTMEDQVTELDIGAQYEEWYERIASQASSECEKAGLPQDGEGCYYWTGTGRECPLKWRASLFMPRWCSRMLLECEEDARLEHLHDITEAEAESEGVERLQLSPGVIDFGSGPVRVHPFTSSYLDAFKALWSTLHTKPGERWEDNPELVRVGRFRRVQ